MSEWADLVRAIDEAGPRTLVAIFAALSVGAGVYIWRSDRRNPPRDPIADLGAKVDRIADAQDRMTDVQKSQGQTLANVDKRVARIEGYIDGKKGN